MSTTVSFSKMLHIVEINCTRETEKGFVDLGTGTHLTRASADEREIAFERVRLTAENNCNLGRGGE